MLDWIWWAIMLFLVYEIHQNVRIIIKNQFELGKGIEELDNKG